MLGKQDLTSTLPLQNSKLSIRKNRELMQQSRSDHIRNKTHANSARQLPSLPRPPPSSNHEQFEFNSQRMEVNYGCGCLSLAGCTRSQIYISPSQVISRALLARDTLLPCHRT